MKGSNLTACLRHRQQGLQGMSMPANSFRLIPGPGGELLRNAIAGDIKALIQIVDLLGHYYSLPGKFFLGVYTPQHLPLASNMRFLQSISDGSYCEAVQDRRILAFLKGLSEEIVYRLNTSLADKSINELIDFEKYQVNSMIEQKVCLNTREREQMSSAWLISCMSHSGPLQRGTYILDLTDAKSLYRGQSLPHCSLLGRGFECAKEQEVPIGVSVTSWTTAQLIAARYCMSSGKTEKALHHLQKVSLMTYRVIDNILRLLAFRPGIELIS